LDSPPFPNSDWSYGGSPVIGEPDGDSYPLMTAIDGAKDRSKVYGWVDPTLNFSTSTRSNAPEANDVYSNRFEMNQPVLYAERLPDSVRRDRVDWGYHLTALERCAGEPSMRGVLDFGGINRSRRPERR
jgi:hypothetical protein